VAGDLDHGLLELVEDDAHRIQHLVEARVEVGAVGGERDVARHVERDVVAHARDADTRPLELRPQLGLLPVHVVADASTGERAEAGSHERSLLALHRAVARDEARDRAGCRADDRLALRAGGPLLAGVRVEGRAGRHHGGKTESRKAQSVELTSRHLRHLPCLAACIMPIRA
jgi:hypothetical protein